MVLGLRVILCIRQWAVPVWNKDLEAFPHFPLHGRKDGMTLGTDVIVALRLWMKPVIFFLSHILYHFNCRFTGCGSMWQVDSTRSWVHRPMWSVTENFRFIYYTSISDVLTWLGPKAMALAWLSTAWAFIIFRLGQICQWWLALAQLWPDSELQPVM
jgi:hypothetical protein